VATELFFGISDTGASRDVKKAQCELRRLFSDDLFGGSSLLSSFGPESNELLARQELAVAMELDRCIGRARRILAENRVFLEAMTAALLKKGLLTGEDVREIRRGSTRECA
jgi:ATP-dependent Zn protease